MTNDQFALLQDKISVWRRAAEWGPLDLRDYNTRAEAALSAALTERAELVRALQLARWYVADHQEAQPNEETAGHLALIDAALEGAKSLPPEQPTPASPDETYEGMQAPERSETERSTNK